MTHAFPLCCEPRHEAAVRGLIDGCVDFVRARLSPPTLVGVVLIGSYARGEGSVLSLPGRLKVLGDIEFFVVLARASDYRRLRPEMATWGRAAAAALGGRGIHVDIEFGPVDVGYFRRARPSIFLYDLRHHGKVLWGPPDLLAPIPPFDASRIPRDDALRLLFNRTIEQLDIHDRLDDLEGESLLDAGYQRLKLVLDLAGSALAFGGVHCASYRQRPAALARLLAETPSLADRLPPAFERDLADATLAKLAPDGHDFFDSDGETAQTRAAIRAQVAAGVSALTGLVQWELEQMLGRRGDLEELLAAYLRSPSLLRRAWDWTKLLMNPLPAPLPIDLVAAARLFCTSTPRALLYAAGALAYRDLDGTRSGAERIARLLPLDRRAHARDDVALRRAIVALWRWCVRNS